jgi:hypothetical protein
LNILEPGYAVPNPGSPLTLPRSEGYACHDQRIGSGSFETLSTRKNST